MQDSGSLAVFKVTAMDQGKYKGPLGAFLLTVTFLVFFFYYYCYFCYYGHIRYVFIVTAEEFCRTFFCVCIRIL